MENLIDYNYQLTKIKAILDLRYNFFFNVSKKRLISSKASKLKTFTFLFWIAECYSFLA